MANPTSINGIKFKPPSHTIFDSAYKDFIREISIFLDGYQITNDQSSNQDLHHTILYVRESC
jgi:hypothetical protein